MMYDTANPGLLAHLRHMHRDMDPSSEYYNAVLLLDGDEPSEDERYLVGAQRTPTAGLARRAFLTRPFQLKSPIRMLIVSGAIMEVLYKVEEKIDRTEAMMEAIGKVFSEILRLHSQSSLTEDDFTTEIHSYPLWRETTSSYFQIASRLPYLHQLRLLARVLGTMTPNESEYAVRQMLDLLWFGVELPSLSQTVHAASKMKYCADVCNGSDDPSMAMVLYCRTILAILPWFPSECYMAPWEARMNGVGKLLVQCNMNIAIIAITTAEDYGTAHDILEFTSALACVTNWEMAKILHLQSLIAAKKEPKEPISRAKRSEDQAEGMLSMLFGTPFRPTKRVTTLPRSTLLTKRDAFLALPQRRIAKEPWVGDFSPKYFSDHYETLRSTLDAKRAKDREAHLPWWETADDREAYWMRDWVNKMAVKLAKHKEGLTVAEEAQEGDTDDLALDNAQHDLQRQVTEVEKRVRKARAELAAGERASRESCGRDAGLIPTLLAPFEYEGPGTAI